MSLDLDDAQQFKHSCSTLAEMADELRQALRHEGISHTLADEMVLAWWKETVLPVLRTDPLENLTTLMKQMLSASADD